MKVFLKEVLNTHTWQVLTKEKKKSPDTRTRLVCSKVDTHTTLVQNQLPAE
jgi:hypothetical protein